MKRQIRCYDDFHGLQIGDQIWSQMGWWEVIGEDDSQPHPDVPPPAKTLKHRASGEVITVGWLSCAADGGIVDEHLDLVGGLRGAALVANH